MSPSTSEGPHSSANRQAAAGSGPPRSAPRGGPGCTRHGPAGSRRACRPAPSRAPGGPSGRRCSCRSRRTPGRLCRTRCTRSSASSSVVVSGLSQITSRPCASASRAAAWCRPFGVMIASTSMPSGARRFPCDQLGMVGIGALGRDADRCRRRARASGIPAQHARDYLEMIVHARGDAMDLADERAGAAADHAEPQPAAQSLERRVHDPYLPVCIRLVAPGLARSGAAVVASARIVHYKAQASSWPSRSDRARQTEFPG